MRLIQIVPMEIPPTTGNEAHRHRQCVDWTSGLIIAMMVSHKYFQQGQAMDGILEIKKN